MCSNRENLTIDTGRRLTLNEATVPRPRKEQQFKVYFTEEDLRILEKVSADRGQSPDDFVTYATLKLLAELGVVGEERKRLLLLFA